MRELAEAGLDKLLHRRGLVDDPLHHVVDRLDLNGRRALAHLFLVGIGEAANEMLYGTGWRAWSNAAAMTNTAYCSHQKCFEELMKDKTKIVSGFRTLVHCARMRYLYHRHCVLKRFESEKLHLLELFGRSSPCLVVARQGGSDAGGS